MLGRPKIEDPEERLIEEMMERVCAWCQTGMGQTRGPVGSVTHGICTACFERMMPGVPLPEPGSHCISPRLKEEVMKLLGTAWLTLASEGPSAKGEVRSPAANCIGENLKADLLDLLDERPGIDEEIKRKIENLPVCDPRLKTQQLAQLLLGPKEA